MHAWHWMPRFSLSNRIGTQQPGAVRVDLSQRPRKGRHQRNIYGVKRKGRSCEKNARGAREPSLLAGGLGLRHLNADAIVRLYSQRMRIEQSFRDTKNLRLGLKLAALRSRSGPRPAVFLLIAHLASLAQWMIGENARQYRLELQFMATQRSKRPEISVLTSGRRILDAAQRSLHQFVPWRAIPPLTKQAARACATIAK